MILTEEIIKTLPILTEEDRKDMMHTKEELQESALEGLEEELRRIDEEFENDNS